MSLLTRLATWAAKGTTHVLAALVYLAAAHLAVLPTAASASVAGAMDVFFTDMGAAANVTGPTAFEGQSAGYYSLGNIWTRFPQKTVNPLTVQTPGYRFGCGGIDLFAGSFSFINASEIVALMKAVANNAVGFAFKLAIDTVCPECSKVMEEMRQAAQLMNNQTIASCDAAQAAVGMMWPQADQAQRAFCEAVGSNSGRFSDWAASRRGCGVGGEREAVNQAAQSDEKLKDINPGVARNYSWHALKKSAFFSPGGVFNRELAEYVMTLVGTIVYVPSGADAAGRYEPHSGDVTSTLVTAILDGAPTITILKCNSADDVPAGSGPDPCIDIGTQTVAIPADKALRTRVADLIASIATKIRTDTPISAAEVELLQVASLPLYKILTVNAAHARTLNTDDRATLAEIVAMDLLFAIMDQLISEVGKAQAGLQMADAETLARWHSQVDDARKTLQNRQLSLQGKVDVVMQIIQRTSFIESVLQNSLSPGMSASLDWSRGVMQRGLN